MEHIFCFFLVVLASTWAEDIATILNPRGARPVEHGYKDDKCATEKNWPFCSDDDWGPKCPSGCRIQGLLDKADHSLLKKIEKIRQLLDQSRTKHRSADQASKQTYEYLKEKLTSNAGDDNSFYDLAERLRQRIVDIKIKIERQLRILNALKTSIKDQVIEMQRLEVDIDIKLRTCKGSCKGYAEFSVDKESYMALDKQMDQLEAQSVQSVETVRTLYVMKSRPLKDVVVDSKYKSGLAEEQKEVFFPEVKTVKLTLETQGSSASSAATASKVPGTHFKPSTSGSSSSSGLSTGSGTKDGPRKTTTELGGGGGTRGDGVGDFFKGMGGFGGGLGSLGGGDFATTGHLTTQTLSCTKTTKRTIVHTKDGPEERVEEVLSGPFCEAQKHGGGGRGGMGEIFPSLTSSSSSSSSSFTKTTSHGGTKGGSSILTSTGSGFEEDPFGMDLGAFKRGNEDDDIPDFHARSVKTSVQSERQEDYVGKDCSDIQRNHLTGEKSGLYKINPSASLSHPSPNGVVEVYCDQEGFLGGWTLVQQRAHGGVSFNRSWADYQKGFGGVDGQGKGEVWLGLKHLHLLTREDSMLRVELEDWEGGVATAEYTVKVGSEAEGYQLTVAEYTGDAGDALVKGESSVGSQGSPGLRSFLSHEGMKFSTFDKDNDQWEESCAEMYGGGWWYNNCQSANLNGVYYKGGKYDPGSNVPYEIENGVVWLTYKPADYSLKTTRMKIRPLAMV
uniref:Fibrinogen alpha chain n=1 Tax=Hucho hucho TaxID=62062 RepID=A0A4W5K227_9TELE